MRKTLQIIDRYTRLISEQGDVGSDIPADAQPVGVGDVTELPQQQELPFTSESENEYILLMLQSAKFKPTPEQNTALDNLIDQMQSKKYTNARLEILPKIQQMISSQIDSNQIRDLSDQID